MKENMLSGSMNRILQILARFAPGASTLRVYLHRLRGVKIGKGVSIGYDSIIETSSPNLVSIGDRSVIGIRTLILAHFRELKSVVIEEDVFIGPGVTILANVRIGKGAVVAAGSVVTTSVPTMTLVQGNPARPVARCGIILDWEISSKKFLQNLKPIKKVFKK